MASPAFAAQLQEALDELGPDTLEVLFELPPPVLEWIELVERRSGQGNLARLLISLEAFIEKVTPEVRRQAEREGAKGSWWPAVSAASKLAYQGRQLGLTDTRTKLPGYGGSFDGALFKRMLQKIRSESDHNALRTRASKALELAPA